MNFNGISINYSDKFNFPFGLITCGEVYLDHNKVGSFAYNEQEEDYILLINPAQQERFTERIEGYFMENLLTNYDPKSFFKMITQEH